MDVRAAHHNNESTMAIRDREIIFRFGSEAHAALRHARDNLLTEHNQLILEGIKHKERTQGIWNRSFEIGISFAKNQNTSATCMKITKMSARLPMTDVQTLSHQLKVARDNSDNLQKQLQQQKQQSSKFQVNLSETARFLDEGNCAHRDSHMLRQKNTKMKQRKTIDGETEL